MLTIFPYPKLFNKNRLLPPASEIMFGFDFSFLFLAFRILQFRKMSVCVALPSAVFSLLIYIYNIQCTHFFSSSTEKLLSQISSFNVAIILCSHMHSMLSQHAINRSKTKKQKTGLFFLSKPEKLLLFSFKWPHCVQATNI